MKPFDLAATQRGEPAVTRDGKPYTFGAANLEAKDEFAIAGWIDKKRTSHYATGKFFLKSECRHDLFMAPKKQQRWIRWFRWNPSHRTICVVTGNGAELADLEGDPPTNAEWITDVLPCGEWEE